MSSGLQQIRLLTFNQLPDFAFSQAQTSLSDTMNRLTAGAVFFENHYLQSGGLSSILGVGNSAFDFRLLERTIASGSLKAAAVFHGEQIVYEEFRKQLPECFVSYFVAAENDCVAGGMSASEVGALQKFDFVWVHCDLSVMTLADADADAAFESHVLLCQKYLCGCGDSLVFITSLNGLPSSQELPFESRLFECEIRVPLWVTGHDVPARRIQAISGSFDIAFTISECLTKHESGIAADVQDAASVYDLRHLYLNPDNDTARTLSIETQQMNAIRTNDFLFVKTKRDSGQSDVRSFSEVALYVKPQDVWNLNDVSSEYMQIAQEFSSLVD